MISLMYAPYSTYYEREAYSAGFEDGYEEGYRDAIISEAEKDQIRWQIQEEINRNQVDGQLAYSLVEKLNDPDYIFIVSSEMTALPEGSYDQGCTLDEGDLLKAISSPTSGVHFARMQVITSKEGNCPAGSVVAISLEDLQQFQNDFSEAIEFGLERLEREEDTLEFLP